VKALLIKCKFLDDNNSPKGREYTYGSREDVAVGEVVTTSDGKRLVVTSTDVPHDEAEKWGENLKYINPIIDVEPESVAIEDAVETQNLIVVKQLPIIEERLKSLSDEIDAKVNSALALPCTEDNIKAVKAARADLNKTFEALERQRIEVKNAIMTPYEQFNGIYKTYVSDKIKTADTTLKNRISDVESELKSKKEEEVKLYFNEYLCSKDIDFISYEDAKINVTLSASLKSLKKQAKDFIDRIADDLALIQTQEHKEEILVEYKKNLNCSQAITAVTARHKAIEEQKAKQAEIEARRQAQAEAIKKVETVASTPLKPPKQTEIPLAPSDPVRTLSFKVTAPISKLRELKAFLVEGGYQYE
jgi:hypothetical protein